jgi:hypothetical protein
MKRDTTWGGYNAMGDAPIFVAFAGMGGSEVQGARSEVRGQKSEVRGPRSK